MNLPDGLEDGNTHLEKRIFMCEMLVLYKTPQYVFVLLQFI